MFSVVNPLLAKTIRGSIIVPNMKKLLTAFLSAVVLALPAGAEAATFKNCSALNKIYPNGVAKSAAAANKQKKLPKVSKSIYSQHLKMDRDKDGTICEK